MKNKIWLQATFMHLQTWKNVCFHRIITFFFICRTKENNENRKIGLHNLPSFKSHHYEMFASQLDFKTIFYFTGVIQGFETINLCPYFFAYIKVYIWNTSRQYQDTRANLQKSPPRGQKPHMQKHTDPLSVAWLKSLSLHLI